MEKEKLSSPEYVKLSVSEHDILEDSSRSEYIELIRVFNIPIITKKTRWHKRYLLFGIIPVLKIYKESYSLEPHCGYKLRYSGFALFGIPLYRKHLKHYYVERNDV